MKLIVRILALAAAYYLAAELGLRLASVGLFVSAVWPPTGIAVAVLLLTGQRVWPGIALAAFLANFAHGAPPATAALIAAGNTLGPLAIVWLLDRWGFDTAMARTRDVIALTCAAVLGVVVSASVGALVLRSFDLIGPESTTVAWTVWWVGDFMGVILLTPAVLLIRAALRTDQVYPARSRNWESLALMILAGLSTTMLFRLELPLVFLLFVFVLWSGLRLPTEISAVLNLVVAGIAVWHTFSGEGPFADLPMHLSLAILSAFNGSIAITSLVLATVSKERSLAQLKLEGAAAFLERRVSERTGALDLTIAELARSNRDLEQMASLASHDLSEPLRVISSYAELLAQDRGASLDERSVRLTHIIEEAERMRGLIKELLEYSRSGRAKLNPEWVDCGRLLSSVLASLDELVREKRASIAVDELPLVLADPVQIRVVFQNLIANSLTFSRPEVEPFVTVGAAYHEGGWLFSVTDNGIGVDPVHRKRIFDMFERLHPRDQYAGSGIGLALCQQVVERHGGTIWVEEGVDGGSRFCFTLPSPLPPADLSGVSASR